VHLAQVVVSRKLSGARSLSWRDAGRMPALHPRRVTAGLLYCSAGLLRRSAACVSPRSACSRSRLASRVGSALLPSRLASRVGSTPRPSRLASRVGSTPRPSRLASRVGSTPQPSRLASRVVRPMAMSEGERRHPAPAAQPSHYKLGHALSLRRALATAQTGSRAGRYRGCAARGVHPGCHGASMRNVAPIWRP